MGMLVYMMKCLCLTFNSLLLCSEAAVSSPLPKFKAKRR